MSSRRSEEAVESLHHGVDALFCQGLHDTFTGLKGMRSWPIFRALRHLARAHGGAQDALGPIVGGLDAQVRQAPQQIPMLMVPADVVEQPLMVRLRQAAMTQGMGDRIPQALGLRGAVGNLSGVRPVPRLHRVLQQALAPLSAIASPAFLRLQHVTDRPQRERSLSHEGRSTCGTT